jgi:hypothetical protein
LRAMQFVYLPASMCDAMGQGSADWVAVWNSTAERVLAGDSIVLMSEEALQIYSDEEEQQILGR